MLDFIAQLPLRLLERCCYPDRRCPLHLVNRILATTALEETKRPAYAFERTLNEMIRA